jgi:hypothetical protein
MSSPDFREELVNEHIRELQAAIATRRLTTHARA